MTKWEAKNIVCPVCLKSQSPILVEVWRQYKLFFCKHCDVVFSDPFKAGELGWYENVEHYQLARFSKKIYWHHKQFLSAPPYGRRLLDIGCGNGSFLPYAEKMGYDVAGIDFNRYSIEAGKQAFGLHNLSCCTLEEFAAQFADEMFDVITAFEIIEHLENPNQFMNTLRCLLKPGGCLAVSVPNRDMLINPFGDAVYPPHHLTFWSAKALNNFLDAHGFTILSHKLKKVNSEDIAKWFDYNVLRKLDYTIRKRIKLKVARKFEKRWQIGDIKNVSVAMVLRQVELNFLKGLFWPFAMIMRLLVKKGIGQYVLAKKNGR